MRGAFTDTLGRPGSRAAPTSLYEVHSLADILRSLLNT